MHSYRSLSRPDQKKAIPGPGGRIERGHTIRLGEVYRAETTLTHNTCFIPRATLVASLLPSRETRAHAEMRSLFSGLTQQLLKGIWPWFPILEPSDEYEPQSSLLLKIWMLLQLCSAHSELFLQARLAINNSTYRLKWMLKYTCLQIDRIHCRFILSPKMIRYIFMRSSRAL